MTVGPLTVTQEAFKILIAELEIHRNSPGGAHRAALLELVDVMTQYAFDNEFGRKAFGLPTGCGKTSAIVAWITAVHRLGMEDVAVSIAAGQVEALCGIKRSLIRHGVPESLIGLKHSQLASEPSTGKEDHRFQLVTHARVRGGTVVDLLCRHGEKKRKLMIYDETFFRSNTSSVSLRDLSVALKGFVEHVDPMGSSYAPLVSYLERCRGLIEARVNELNAGSSESVIRLPELHPTELNGFHGLLDQAMVRMVNIDPLKSLLEVSQKPLRVVSTGQGAGVIWHELAIPRELHNVIVLDASYHIRKIVQLDDTLTEGWSFKEFDVKRYNNVTVHQLLASGSRTAITQSFKAERQNRDISKEIVAVVKSHSDSKGILLFTYKSHGIDIGRRLLEDMRGAGIDTEERFSDGRKRINLLTWGSETSLNDFVHCDVVIMVGVMQRSQLDIAAMMVGQQDDLSAEIDNKTIKVMLDSEVAHLVYQGASRGSCRIIEDGQAKSMNLYFIHKDSNIREELAKVMPGAAWKTWEPKYTVSVKTSIKDALALQIHQYLESVPETTEKVSSVVIKKAIGIKSNDEAAKKAFSRAIESVLRLSEEWIQDGRSMRRKASVF
ncbi:hypothetical protein ABC383_02145 [Noviherbaspirillum sp. 1P10PC]|uniref:hypothetical protein n=1 Tax=Noviherbaspirillum sp. 1P10PC TaxID=3132292 RepID=UPI0039A0CCC3